MEVTKVYGRILGPTSFVGFPGTTKIRNGHFLAKWGEIGIAKRRNQLDFAKSTF